MPEGTGYVAGAGCWHCVSLVPGPVCQGWDVEALLRGSTLGTSPPPRLSALPRHRPAAGAPLHPCVRCWKEPGPDAAGDPREDLAVEERLPSLLSSWTRTAGAGGQRGADLAAMQRGSGGMRHGAVSGWLGGSAGTVSTPAATPSLSLCHPHHPCPCPWVSGLFGTVGFSAWD